MKRLAFGLLFSLLAAGLAPGAIAESAVTESVDLVYRDRQLASYITGSWYVDSLDGGSPLSQDFTYAADGTFIGVVKQTNPQLGSAALEYRGTWSVDGDTIDGTVRKASNPAIKVPFSERFQITPVDADHLISTAMNSGARTVFSRSPETTEEHLLRMKEAVPDPGGDDAWVEIARSPAGSMSYDKRTLDRRGHIVGAWIRAVLSDATVAEMEKQSSAGQHMPAFKAIRTYSLIDCQRNLTKVRQVRVTMPDGSDVTVNAPAGAPERWTRFNPDMAQNSGPGTVCNVKP